MIRALAWSIGLNSCECRVRIAREQTKSRELPVRMFAVLLSSMCVVVSGPTAVPQALAQDFYRGKSVTLFAGQPPGGGIDSEMRLVAQFLGRHIPGEPAIVPRNMPGAGGINAANYLANIAPRDGSTIHLIMANMMNKQAVGVPGIKFDARKFFWIGNTTSTPNVTSAWHTSGVTNIEQVKERELIIGAPAGTAGEVYGAVMNALVGTKFKVVTGYPGGNEVNLAMERGEIHGRASNSWASWKSTRPDWVRDKKLIVLVQNARPSAAPRPVPAKVG